jgi:uncharacterized protein (UPF0276 family)
MSDIWLAVSGGKPHVDALLATGAIGASAEIDVDRLKAAEWMDDDELDAVRAQRPVVLHVSEGVLWPRSRRWAAAQARVANRVDAPWVSVHLDIGWTLLAYHWPGPAPIPRALAKRWAVRSVRRLQKASALPVLVENMPRWTRSRPAYVVDPAFIAAVVEESGCGLLLDLAHARVAAHYQDEPVRDYLARLPLDRLLEIHVSGPRPRPTDGRLIDAHQPLLEVDYDLLAWVLERSSPRAVTLEYTQDREQIKAQLVRLRALLDRHS